MSVSISTSQLRRQLCAPSSVVWRSLDLLPAATRLPLRQTIPLGRLGLGTSFPAAPTALGSRWYHSYRGNSGSRQQRKSPDNVLRSQSSGLLLLGFAFGPSSTKPAVTSSSPAADSAPSSSVGQKASISHLARQAWAQSRDSGPIRVHAVMGRRCKSSGLEKESSRATVPKEPESQRTPPLEADPGPSAPGSETLAESVSKYLHLPKMPHRPTKEELLAAASGFWQRLGVRFKWFSIRSARPWNADEWGAFVSWFLFGHLVWILVGTTTFFSLIILFINTVFAQETLAKWIGDYLTQSAGVTVIFESAIVPKWKDGVITFRNVFVSRRPGQIKSSVQKGSSNAAAEAAAARQADQDPAPVEEDDGNYTQFDITLSTVNVTLSFVKWWTGRGLLKDVEIKGVRGVVDRTSVNWTADGKDPLSYRHEHQPGDFELDHFKMEDLLVTVHQPNDFRPFSVSIFSCELPQLRRQWLFYDFLSASHMSGSYDGSLFTIHPRQIHGVAPTTDDDDGSNGLGEPAVWKKFSRLRIDGLKIDHLNRGVEGPFGWIYEGNVDIVADVSFPNDAEGGIGKVVAEFYEKMEEAVTSNRYLQMLETNSIANGNNSSIDNINLDPFHGEGVPLPAAPLPTPSISKTTDSSTESGPSDSSPEPTNPHTSHEEEVRGYLVMDLRIHLNDVRAAVPLFPKPHISYVNQALVRPIVAYINAKRTYIPITCRIVKRHTDFDGSWTVWDCGLMDDLGAEVYTAFAHDVEDQQNRVRRFKRVGLWTASLVVHALLAGVAGDLM